MPMTSFEILRQIRTNILSIVDQFDHEQLNHIPAGLNNNLMWNFGHVIITQQLLCYKLSGLPLKINPDLVDKYRKGSRPDGPISVEEFGILKDYLFTTIVQMEADYKNGVFQTYNTYKTSFGMTLDHIDKAIEFNNMHEGMHLGTMLTIKRLLTKD